METFWEVGFERRKLGSAFFWNNLPEDYIAIWLRGG